MIIANVMDELAQACAGIAELNRYAFPHDKPTLPALVVEYPDPLDYLMTYKRGAAQFRIKIHCLAARGDMKSARDALTAYADGSGPRAVVPALEAFPYTSCDVVTVLSATFGPVVWFGVDMLATSFDVQVDGKGM